MQSVNLLLLLPALVSSAYNETLAIQYANLAGASYCDVNTLHSWTCGQKCIKGVSSVKVCQGDTTIAFVGIFNGNCVASFEGTNGFASVKVDLAASSVPFLCPGCLVHEGFLGEWRTLETCVKASLQDIGCGLEQPLHGTGHSLGGALVAIALMDLKSANWNVAEVYTFGMPRIGNGALASRFGQMFQDQFYRVTHGKDPFIDMPPGPLYTHVEPEVFYKGTLQEGYVVCTSSLDKACSAQYFPNLQNVIRSAYVKYHHNYMGVDTTSADCLSTDASCGGDIPGSWCSYGIPCNKDMRGEQVYCHYGRISHLGYGRCHCNKGYCPVAGRCERRSIAMATVLQPSTADAEIVAEVRRRMVAEARNTSTTNSTTNSTTSLDFESQLTPTEGPLAAPVGAVYRGVGAFHISMFLAFMGVGGIVLRYCYFRREVRAASRVHVKNALEEATDFELNEGFSHNNDVTIGGPLSRVSAGRSHTNAADAEYHDLSTPRGEAGR